MVSEKYTKLLHLLLLCIHHIDDGGTHYKVYIQGNVSWSWRLVIPTGLMFLSVTSPLLEAKLYNRVTPEGSSFRKLLQVFIVAR